MTAHDDPRCERCGLATATVNLSDEVSSPPRYLGLCESCLTAEKGAMFLGALREMGNALSPELDADDAETLMAVGQVWNHLFLDSMDAKALAEAEAESDPEALRFIAATLQADASRFARKLTRAQKAFVRRHGEQARYGPVR